AHLPGGARLGRGVRPPGPHWTPALCDGAQGINSPLMSRRFDCSDPEQRKAGLREAASAVRRGELVVMPTDTLYGIGADAFTNWAVRALLEAKGRGPAMPSPVLVPSPATLHGLVAGMPSVGW